MIPTSTRLSLKKLEIAKGAIEQRHQRLRRTRRDPETALFLMEEIEHLETLVKFNTPP